MSYFQAPSLECGNYWTHRRVDQRWLKALLQVAWSCCFAQVLLAAEHGIYSVEYSRTIIFIRCWFQAIVTLGFCSLICIKYGLSKCMLFACLLNIHNTHIFVLEAWRRGIVLLSFSIMFISRPFLWNMETISPLWNELKLVPPRIVKL